MIQYGSKYVKNTDRIHHNQAPPKNYVVPVSLILMTDSVVVVVLSSPSSSSYRTDDIYWLIDWGIFDQWIHSAEQYSKKSSLHLGASQQFAVFFLYWTQIEQGRGFAGHNMFHKLAHRWKHLCSFHSRPHGTILSLAGLADDNWRHLPIPL